MGEPHFGLPADHVRSSDAGATHEKSLEKTDLLSWRVVGSCSFGELWGVKPEIKHFTTAVANEPIGVSVVFINLVGAYFVERSSRERRATVEL